MSAYQISASRDKLFRPLIHHGEYLYFKYVNVAWFARNHLERRNRGRYADKINKRVYGRAFRTYMKIAKLEGYL